MSASWILVPLIGAFIGWVTNWLAIKMLFHPRCERRVLGLRLQGVFPKRQKLLAEKLGEIVAEELFSVGDVQQHLLTQAKNPRLHNLIDLYLEEALNKKLPEAIPMIRMVLTPVLVGTVKAVFFKDLEKMLHHFIGEVSENIGDTVDIKATVRAKVEAFSSDRLETLLLSLMKQEFSFIETVGAVLGFAIGLMQMAVAEFLR